MPPTLGGLGRTEVLGAALLAVAVAVPLAVFGPPGGDEPAHLYRTELVRHGVLVWDGFWFAGHYPLASYSLLYYFPAALVGNVPLTVAAVVAAAAIFASLARHEWGADALWPSLLFAVVAAGPIFTGTYPYALGLMTLLATLRFLQLGRVWLAAACVALTLGFSPLAFLFLCLALVAIALVRRRLDRPVVIVGLVACVVGAFQSAVLAVFAHDATYPFFRGWELIAVVAAGTVGTALSLQSSRGRVLAAFFALWTLAAALAFLIPTPVGENVSRLRGLLLPLLVLAAVLARFRPRWLAGVALLGAVAYTLVPYVGAAPHRGDSRSAEAPFWAPAIAFLREHESAGYRVEVVPTGDHWEAYWLPHEGFPLARGWYRQLDYAQNPLFYEDTLESAQYVPWLRRVAVRYVLLPDTQLGRSGEEKEAQLLLSGRSGLRLVLETPNWRIYELPGARPLLRGPGEPKIERYGHDAISGSTSVAGDYWLAVRFTKYWRVEAGAVCLRSSADGMTILRAARPGPFRLEISARAHGSAVC
ncbi:MAG: hypothetical protein ABI649_00765 [Gaiellaceae bacterium]